MCGLYGWSWAEHAGPDFVTRVKLALALAIPAEKRGSQAWGYWDGHRVVKNLGAAVVAVDSGMCATKSLMAHTRQATHGENTIANAHPFEMGKFIGAHNGVLSNHEALNKKFKRDFKVDSQHIWAHLNAGLPFKDLEGYGAITFVKKDTPSRIYMARVSSSGSLRVAHVRDRKSKSKGIIWGSVKSWLEEATHAANLELLSFYEESPTGQVWFAEGGKLKMVPKVDLTMKATTYTDPRTSGYGGGHQRYYSDWEVDEEAESYPQQRVIDLGSSPATKDEEEVDEAMVAEGDKYIVMEDMWKERRPDDYFNSLEMLLEKEREQYDATMSGLILPNKEFVEMCSTLQMYRAAMMADEPFTGFKASRVKQLDKTNWRVCQGRSCFTKVSPKSKNNRCKKCIKENNPVWNSGTSSHSSSHSNYGSSLMPWSECLGVGDRKCSSSTGDASKRCFRCRQEIDTGWYSGFSSFDSTGNSKMERLYCSKNVQWTKEVHYESEDPKKPYQGWKVKEVRFNCEEAQKWDEEFQKAKALMKNTENGVVQLAVIRSKELQP